MVILAEKFFAATLVCDAKFIRVSKCLHEGVVLAYFKEFVEAQVSS